MNQNPLVLCLLLLVTATAQAQISIDPPSRTFAKEGGSSAVLTSGSGTWTATTSTPWITINRATASAGTSCLYTVSANFTAAMRQGTIAISGNTHTVTQTGYPASLDPGFVNQDKNTASGILQINTAAGVSWNAVPNVPWLSFSPASGSGPTTISFSVQAYTGVVPRTGIATIAGQTFIVNQTGMDVNVSPLEVSKGPGADIFELQITALATTQWTITPKDPWISVVDGATGQGGASVFLAVSANPSYFPRTGTVTIGTVTLEVTQEPTPNVAVSITPAITTASYQGAVGNIAVSATPDAPWSAESLSPWITLGPGSSSGDGNGNVKYAVSANPTTAERIGKVIVRGAPPTPTFPYFATTSGESSITAKSGFLLNGRTNEYVSGADGLITTSASQNNLFAGYDRYGRLGDSMNFSASTRSVAINQEFRTVSFWLRSTNVGNKKIWGAATSGGVVKSRFRYSSGGFTPDYVYMEGSQTDGNAVFSISTDSLGRLKIECVRITEGQFYPDVYASRPPSIIARTPYSPEYRFDKWISPAWNPATYVFESTASLVPGQWHNLTMTLSASGVIHLFLDGSRCLSVGDFWTDLYGKAFKNIGSESFNGWINKNAAMGGLAVQNFEGQLDDVALYDNELSDININELYDLSKVIELTHSVTQRVSPISLTPEDSTVPTAGGAVETTLTVADNVTWTASSNSAWLTLLSSSGGAGSAAVRWSADANSTVYERVATVTVAGVTARVRQPGRAVTVSSSNIIIPPDGGSVQVSVSAEGGASWQSVSTDGWLSVIAGSTGVGSGNVTIVADPYNQSSASRTGVVLVAGRTVYVTQRGYELTVNPTTAQFYANSGSATIAVSAPLSAIWQAISSHPWITITGGSDGMGGGSVIYSIASNTTGQTRTGRIVISGAEYVINQAANAPDPVIIVAPPIGGAVNPGQSFSFSIGIDGSGPFSYQWRRNLVNLGGATNSTYVISSVNEGHEGSYDCVVTNTLGNVISPAAELNINDPLAIVSQPANRMVNPTTSVRFGLNVTGAQPITYQWRKGGVNLPGETGAELVLLDVLESDEGSYDVVLTNPVGSLISAAATLSINDPVQITAQPQDRTLNPGMTLSLSVGSTGTAPITYQWRKNGLPLTGVAANSFSLATVTEQDAGEYDVVVTNVVGSLTSLPVSVVVNQAPRFTTQPVSQQLNPAATATFVVVAEGMTPLSYQWRKDGVDLAGETQATLMLTSVANPMEGSYSCRVTNPVGSLVSQVAVLAVNDPIQITLQPVARIVNPGAAVSFSVTATGTSPSYQWRKDGVAIQGANAASYSIASAAEAHEGSYDCVVSNMLGSVNSQMVALSVNDQVVITGQPSTLAVDVNTPLSLQVIASGTGPLTYQWRKAGVNLPGVTTATLTIVLAQATDAGSYDVLVTNTVGTVTSQPAVVTVHLSPTITTQPADLTLNPDSTAVFTVAASGQVPLSYQWYKNGQIISGAQSSSLSLSSISETAEALYSVVVTNRLGDATSRSALLVVNDPITITAQPLARIVNPGTAVSFTVAATGTSPGYQWRRNGAPISGATSATYSIASAVESQEGSYDCVLSNVVGSVTSNAVTLSVNDPVVITTQPINRTLVESGTLNLSVAATGTGPLAYQWKKDGGILAGATASAYAVASVTAADAGSYTVEVSNGVGTVISNATTVTVNLPITITMQPVARTVNPGTAVSFTVAATGTSPGYQWRRNGAPISGATSATYSIASAVESQEGSYDCVLSNVVGSVTSSAVTLNVNDPVVITTQPASQTLNPGATAVFSVQVTGTGPFTYQWKKGGLILSGANAASYSLASAVLADAGSYTVEVSNVVGAVTSSAALFAVNLPITITAQPLSRTVNPGTAVSFTVAATGASPSYQWRRNGVNLPGATLTSYSIGAAAESHEGDYDCLVTNVVGSVTTAAAVLRINDPMVITAQPPARTVNPGTEVVMTVTATGTGPISYQWRRNGVNLAGETSASLGIASVQESQQGSYTCLLSNAVGDLLSSTAVLIVNDPVVFTTQPASQSRNPGQSVTFGVTATGTGPLAYQWRKNGVDLAGATSASLTIPALQKADEGGYSCAVSNIVGQVLSAVADLSVSDAPVLVEVPIAQTVNPGASVTLRVTASGTAPFSYQWRRNGAVVTGETTNTLTFASVAESHQGTYEVTVTNAVGSVTSSPVMVTVNDPVVILQQPRGGAVSLGSSLGLAVAVSGTDPITYQWRRDGVDLPGATDSTYLVEALAESATGIYSVRVSNPVGAVLSQVVLVTVDTGAPRIVAAPMSQVLVVGDSAEFEVRAAGAGPFAYQWRRNGQLIAGAVSSILRLDNVQLVQAGSYSVQVTGPGGTVGSAAAQLGVVESISRTVHQAPGTSVNFVVRANGSGLFYEWRKDGVPLVADTRIVGPGTARLSLRSIRAEDVGFYTCRVSWVAAAGQVLDTASVLAGEYELVPLEGRPAFVRPFSLPVARVGADYEYELPTDPTPGITPTWFKATGLPSGLSLDVATGVISGRPTGGREAPYAVSLLAGNASGSDAATTSMIVDPMPEGIAGAFVAVVPRNGMAPVGGRMDLSVTSAGSAAGKLTLGSLGYSFRAQLEMDDALGQAVLNGVIPRRGLPELSFQLTIFPEENSFAGWIREDSEDLDIEGVRLIWQNRTQPASGHEGKHHLALNIPAELSSDPGLPASGGFAIVSVSTSGYFKWAGRTGDGTATTSGSFVGPRGEMVVHSMLRLPGGSLNGLAHLDAESFDGAMDASFSDVDSLLTWSRAAGTAKERLYRTGFGPVQLGVNGGQYVPSVARLMLDLALPVTANNARLNFYGANLPASGPDIVFSILPGNNLLLPRPGPENPRGTKLLVNVRNGSLNGSFAVIESNPFTKSGTPQNLTRNVQFQGILIPGRAGEKEYGHGYFLMPAMPSNVNETLATTPILGGAAILYSNED